MQSILSTTHWNRYRSKTITVFLCDFFSNIFIVLVWSVKHQEQVTEALREAGLESSNLIVGIDFTKSNEWTGSCSSYKNCAIDPARSFLNYKISLLTFKQYLERRQIILWWSKLAWHKRKSTEPLRASNTDHRPNPFRFWRGRSYPMLRLWWWSVLRLTHLSEIGLYSLSWIFAYERSVLKSLAVTTHDKDVFSFYPDGSPCDGFREALQRYRELAPGIKLSGRHSQVVILSFDFERSYNFAIIVVDIYCYWIRTNIICSDNWSSNEHCGWEWWTVPCSSNYSRWTGCLSVYVKMFHSPAVDSFLGFQFLKVPCLIVLGESKLWCRNRPL